MATKQPPKEPSALVLRAAGELELDPDQMELIRSAVAPDLKTDEQLALFLFQCQRKGLDPLAGDMYAFEDKGRISIGTRIDGMRKKAQATGAYAPGPTVYENDPKTGELRAAHVTVYRWAELGGEMQRLEITESAFLDEFDRGTPVWRKMPRVMLAKCAEARALRRGFPDPLDGMYEAAELPDGLAPASVRQGAIDVPAEAPDPAPPPATTPAPCRPSLPDDHPAKVAWRACQALGATAELVTQAAEDVGAPDDRVKWTTEDADQVIGRVEQLTGGGR